MAMKRVDEFDGVSDAEIVEWSIEGTVYHMDLSDASRTRFYRSVQEWIGVSRKVATRASKSKKRSTHSSPPKPAEGGIDNDAVRSWARSTGKKVSDRGRIPKDVIDAFRESQAPNAVQPAFSGA